MQIYILKISYLKQAENGSIYKKTEEFAVEALSFTEAEANLQASLEETVPEYNLKAMTLSKITDVLLNDVEADYFFNVKISFSSHDEDTGKEKQVNQFFLVRSNSSKEANDAVLELMQGSVVEFEIQSVVKTKIEEFFAVEVKA